MFQKVLYLARNISKDYNPPNIKLVVKDLLDVIHNDNMKSNLVMIKNDPDNLRLLFLGDGAKFSITPLLNILVSGF